MKATSNATNFRGNMKSVAFAFATLASIVSTSVYSENAPPSVVPPKASGTPHVCSEYPDAALKDGTQGVTGLGFRVEKDGSTRDVSVTASSGSTDLDHAAIACVSTWRYSPASQNGEAVTTDWKANVVWKIQEIPPSANGEHKCAVPPARHEPDVALGEARLSFFVAIDGKVKDIYVYQSSGDADTDAALKQCVSAWIYLPVT